MLSPDQIKQFHEQGFTVIADLFSAAQLDPLKTQAQKLIDQYAKPGPGQSFTTKNNERSEDDHFLDSAEGIACFFEEDALDDSGALIRPLAQSINKIGHALHELDPVFAAFSHLPVLGEIAADIGLQQPQIRQSMYICKPPRIGGVVNWHQDASFFYTTPHSVTTFWFAVEQATLENGCLWIEPGGHKGPLRERFTRDGRNTTMQILDHTPWPDERSAVPLPVAAGTLVCFHGKLPHYSAPNRSSSSRQAYTLHVTDGTTEYAKNNWLQTRRLPLRGFVRGSL